VLQKVSKASRVSKVLQKVPKVHKTSKVKQVILGVGRLAVSVQKSSAPACVSGRLLKNFQVYANACN
jgi:hypothetical protein